MRAVMLMAMVAGCGAAEGYRPEPDLWQAPAPPDMTRPMGTPGSRCVEGPVGGCIGTAEEPCPPWDGCDQPTGMPSDATEVRADCIVYRCVQSYRMSTGNTCENRGDGWVCR